MPMYGNKDGNYGVKPVANAKAAGANLSESRLNYGSGTEWKGKRGMSYGKSMSREAGMPYQKKMSYKKGSHKGMKY